MLEKKQENESRNANRENQSVSIEWKGIDVNSFDEMEHHLEEKRIEDETKKSDSILESLRIERERRNAKDDITT